MSLWTPVVVFLGLVFKTTTWLLVLTATLGGGYHYWRTRKERQ